MNRLIMEVITLGKIKTDLVGKRFGKLIVKNDYIKTKSNKAKWLCKCDCGNEKYILRHDLISGSTKSCGCIKSSIGNLSNTRIYQIWANIKYRCFNSNCSAYKDYGGKGITICDEWLDFMNFYNWAINNGYSDNLTIDRIDVNGNYEPDNCRWVTKSENTAYANKTNHRRKAKYWYYGISPNGEYFEFDNASQFAKEHNLNDKLIRAMANGEKYKNSKYKGWKFGFTNKKIV